MLIKRILVFGIGVSVLFSHLGVAQEFSATGNLSIKLAKTIPLNGEIYKMDIIREPSAVVNGKKIQYFVMSGNRLIFFDDNDRPMVEKKFNLNYERLSVSGNGKFVFIWNSKTGLARLETIEGKTLWEKEVPGRIRGPLTPGIGHPLVTPDGRVVLPLTGPSDFPNESPDISYNYNDNDQLQVYDESGNLKNLGSLKDGDVKFGSVAVAMSTDGHYYGLACRLRNSNGTESEVFALYDLHNLTELWVKHLGEEVTGISGRIVVSQNGQYVVSVVQNNGINTSINRNLYFISEEGKILTNQSLGEYGSIRGEISPDGKYMAASGFQENIWSLNLFEVSTGKLFWKYSGIKNDAKVWFPWVLLSNSAKIAASSYWKPEGTTVLIFNNTGQIIAENIAGPLGIMSFSGENLWLSDNNSIRHFQIESK